MTDLKKRNSLKLFTAASASLGLLSVSGCQSVTALPVSAKDADDLRQWQQADQIIAAIKPVKFPDRSFSITDFGAAAKAGFDPETAVTLWQKMTAAGGGSGPGFLSTHPSGPDRIRQLQDNVPKVEALFNQARRSG